MAKICMHTLNLGQYLDRVRKKKPLVHNITNYVTVNDVANIILACGGSPIMADDPEEVEEITAGCDALNINLGTLQKRTIQSMLLAGKRAGELGHALVLDPVGAGASRLRNQTAKKLIREVPLGVIRGNVSEMKALAVGSRNVNGVDAGVTDTVTEGNLPQMAEVLKAYAAEIGIVLAVTGAIDLVTDGKQCYVIRNGVPEMKLVTGTGCQLSGLLAAFTAAAPENTLESAAAAVCAMGIAGEIARSHLQKWEGSGMLRVRMVDAICHMDGRVLNERGKVMLL